MSKQTTQKTGMSALSIIYALVQAAFIIMYYVGVERAANWKWYEVLAPTLIYAGVSLYAFVAAMATVLTALVAKELFGNGVGVLAGFSGFLWATATIVMILLNILNITAFGTLTLLMPTFILVGTPLFAYISYGIYKQILAKK